MMNTIFTGNRQYANPDYQINLDYFITETFIDFDGENTKVYGLKVSKECNNGYEEDHIPYITTDFEEIQILNNRIIGGGVTPCVLAEIIDELFAC